MKKINILLMGIITINLHGAIIQTPIPVTKPLSIAEKEKLDDQQYEESTAKIADYFSQLVGNFFKIVQDRHNSAEVGYNVAGIFDNIIKIGLECMKRSPHTHEWTKEEVENFIKKLEAELHEVLNSIMIKRSKELLPE